MTFELCEFIFQTHSLLICSSKHLTCDERARVAGTLRGFFCFFLHGGRERAKKMTGSHPCSMSVGNRSSAEAKLSVTSLMEATGALQVLRVGLPPAGPGDWTGHEEWLGKDLDRTSAKGGLWGNRHELPVLAAARLGLTS